MIEIEILFFEDFIADNGSVFEGRLGGIGGTALQFAKPHQTVERWGGANFTDFFADSQSAFQE